MTPVSQMTVEHLGDGATESDLAEFRLWVHDLMRTRNLNEQEATDLLYGAGDYVANAFRFGLEQA